MKSAMESAQGASQSQGPGPRGSKEINPPKGTRKDPENDRGMAQVCKGEPGPALSCQPQVPGWPKSTYRMILSMGTLQKFLPPHYQAHAYHGVLCHTSRALLCTRVRKGSLSIPSCWAQAARASAGLL